MMPKGGDCRFLASSRHSFAAKKANYMEENSRGILSGYSSIDKITGGWKKGELILVTGRPGTGKTTFAMNIALNAANEQKVPVGFFSMAADFNELPVGSAIIPELLYIDDTARRTISEIQDNIYSLVNDSKVRLIIIDYLELLDGPKELRGYRKAEICHITHKLKVSARELNIPIIVTSQLPKNSFFQSIYASSIFGISNTIYPIADSVIIIHRERYDTSEYAINPTLIFVAKQRSNQTGIVTIL